MIRELYRYARARRKPWLLPAWIALISVAWIFR